MSDRLVFLDDDDDSRYDWADVIVKKSASDAEILAAAEKFQNMPGPHKVFVTDQEDPRLLKFKEWTWMPEDYYEIRKKQNMA